MELVLETLLYHTSYNYVNCLLKKTLKFLILFYKNRAVSHQSNPYIAVFYFSFWFKLSSSKLIPFMFTVGALLNVFVLFSLSLIITVVCLTVIKGEQFCKAYCDESKSYKLFPLLYLRQYMY